MDSDGDLYVDSVECERGTDPNNATSTPLLGDCGPSIDSDGDGLMDWLETCFFGTNPQSADTDGDRLVDGARDGCEASSFNGDRIVNVADAGMLAVGISGKVAYHSNVDVNKDGVLNPADQGMVASFRVGSRCSQ